MIAINYQHLLNKLIVCREWLSKELDINSPLLEDLLVFLNDLIPKVGLKMPNSEVVNYYQMVYDCFAFVDIYDTFNNFTLNNDIIGKIKRISQMKPIYKMSNCDGRNYLFEFELASFFKSFKFNLTGFEDISFQFEKYDIHIQCKRIASTKKVGKNITKAYCQLKKQYTSNNSRGFIAVSIEQVISRDGTFEGNSNLINEIGQFENEQQIFEVTRQFSTNFNNQYRHTWNWFTDTRLLGIIQVFKFVSKINGNDHLAFIPVIVPLVNDIQLENRYIINKIIDNVRGI